MLNIGPQQPQDRDKDGSIPSVVYYSPSATPAIPPNTAAKTLMLTHTTHTRPAVAGEMMLEENCTRSERVEAE